MKRPRGTKEQVVLGGLPIIWYFWISKCVWGGVGTGLWGWLGGKMLAM